MNYTSVQCIQLQGHIPLSEQILAHMMSYNKFKHLWILKINLHTWMHFNEVLVKVFLLYVLCLASLHPC